MRLVLSREQARDFDRHAAQVACIPSLLLMENAGRSAVELLLRELKETPQSVVVVAGPGNNGGDGFVLARRLRVIGHAAEIWLVGEPGRLTGDAAIMWGAYRGLYGEPRVISSESMLPQLEQRLSSADVVVDALFGTGLTRPIVGLFARVIEAIARSQAFVCSLDIPSGLDANRGRILGTAVKADLTVTFGHAKLGHFSSEGADCCGRLVAVDIGVPSELALRSGHNAERIERDDLCRRLLPRPSSSHKGRAGRVAILAGHAGTIGAALLSARGAQRMGAGSVTHIGLPSAMASIESRVLEAMTKSLDPGSLGQSLTDALHGMDSVVLGPGLGLGAQERQIVAIVSEHMIAPVIVDADALTLLADDPALLKRAKGPRILLPHRGELGRLLHLTTADVEEDPFAALESCVRLTNAIVVLKGAYTLVGAPNQKTAVVGAPCAALGTAGSGDVLSGVVAALAVDHEPLAAALLGVHLHGRSGTKWAESHGSDRGLIASEIADNLPAAIAELASSSAGVTV
jgi:ADP-dependent NAD(P)H-hydrate dehydratase / NAD(P)H-hydrate epimerase